MPATISLPNSTNVRNMIGLAKARMTLALASTFAPERAVLKASKLFTSPPRFAHTARERELLRASEPMVFEAPAGRLAGWRFGGTDRPAVVVSHGWGGRGAQLRSFVTPLVDAGYQVIVFDHAGHGFSEGHEASLMDFMRDLAAVVDAVEAQGVKVVGLVGHSLGAAAVGAYLKASGRSIRSVLVAPPSSLIRYSGHFARMLGIPERIRREMQLRFERRYGVAWSEFELPQSVASIRAPALVIHDANDRDVPFSSGLAVARAWPDARLVRTEGLGHRAILKDGAVVQDAVDFLRAEVMFARPVADDGRNAFAVPSPLL
jgi:pimeloyl-ACP methyl ester carboxylesterase